MHTVKECLLSSHWTPPSPRMLLIFFLSWWKHLFHSLSKFQLHSRVLLTIVSPCHIVDSQTWLILQLLPSLFWTHAFIVWICVHTSGISTIWGYFKILKDVMSNPILHPKQWFSRCCRNGVFERETIHVAVLWGLVLNCILLSHWFCQVWRLPCIQVSSWSPELGTS